MHTCQPPQLTDVTRAVLEHKHNTAREALRCLDFDAAVFDFDGTLALSHDVWRHVDDLFFEKRGLSCPLDYAEKLSILGFEEGARYTIETYGLSESVDEICAEWNAMGRELYATDVSLRPGAAAYVASMRKRGALTALATTNDPDVIEAICLREPVLELFDTRVYGKEVAHPSKHHPDIYLEAARRLGVSERRCVVFEDMPVAAATAKGIGMTVVGVVSGASNQNVDLLSTIADYMICTWEDLL